MWGVPIITFSSSSRSISGSCSHTSMTASDRMPDRRASSSASVSMTSPREVFMITAPFFSEWKKCLSAKWYVLYFPSLYKGTWKVIISHFSAMLFKEANIVLSSLSSLGRSFSITCIPNFRATSATLLPTFPTPTIPMVIWFNFIPRGCCKINSVDWIYCATEAELHPGALVHVMPASRQ